MSHTHDFWGHLPLGWSAFWSAHWNRHYFAHLTTEPHSHWSRIQWEKPEAHLLTDADEGEGPLQSRKRQKTHPNHPQDTSAEENGLLSSALEQIERVSALKPVKSTFSDEKRWTDTLHFAYRVLACHVFDNVDIEQCKAKLFDPLNELPAPPLLSLFDEHPSVASFRRNAYHKMDQLLQEMCKSAGIKPPSFVFQRFGFNQRNLVHNSFSDQCDPLLSLDPHRVPDDDLVRELQREGVETTRALSIANRIAAGCTEEAQKLVNIRSQYRATDLSSLKPIKVKETWSNRGVEMLLLTYDGEGDVELEYTIRINKCHFIKLKRLYDEHMQSTLSRSAESKEDDPVYLRRLFVMLARYDTISGPGYQGAVPEPVFALLQQRFGVQHECFASPLNSFLPHFHSAFYDVDHYFGSLGSFFWSRYREGAYESNPPFVESVMLTNALLVLALLLRAEQAGRSLMFIVVWPDWSDCLAYAFLKETPFLRQLVPLAANQHHYKEGAQHKADTQYRGSIAASVVFFVQSSSAAAKWPITHEFVAEFRKAFAGFEMLL